jgi:hypothetical protein
MRGLRTVKEYARMYLSLNCAATLFLVSCNDFTTFFCRAINSVFA